MSSNATNQAISAGAIGLDLGSNSLVVATVKRGNVEILTNEGSHRETQNIVGFGEHERFIGEAGSLQFKSNFKNTVIYANRLLGLRQDSPLVAEERKFLFNPIVNMPNNRIGLEISYRGEKHQFYPEQIVAMVLQKMKHIVRRQNINPSDMVISCPSYFTEQERKALLDACAIANVNCLKLMNEHVATSLAYGLFRRSEFSNEPRHVAFVDFGHSSTSAYVVAFTKEKMTVLAQGHERNMGTRNLDYKLFEFYCNWFQEQNGVNPAKSDKARLRLFDALEKQRKVLSANGDATLNIEYLIEDYDLNHTLSREQYEELIKPQLERFRDCLKSCLSQLRDGIKLHSVEIIGGGTRIPLVQRIIQETFGVESCSKTLNATECIARGCATQAAILHPLFKVTDYVIEETNYYPIKCSWRFLDGNAANSSKMEIESDDQNKSASQESMLFPSGCAVPSCKSLNFKRFEPIELTLFYDQTPVGAERILGRYWIHPLKPKEAESTVKVRKMLTCSKANEEIREPIISPPQVDNNNLNKDSKNPEAGAGAGDSNGNNGASDNSSANNNNSNNNGSGMATEPQFEIKKKRRTRETALKWEGLVSYHFSSQELDAFNSAENNMHANDRLIQDTYERKNELESFIYDIRGKLDNLYLDYVAPSEKTSILQALQGYEEWLYGEGAKSDKGSYESRIDALRNLCDPFIQRQTEFAAIPDVLTEIETTLRGYEQFAVSKDPNFDHVIEEERLRVIDECKRMREFLAHVEKRLHAWDKKQALPHNRSELMKRYDEFLDICKPIMNKPRLTKAQSKNSSEPTGQQADEKRDTMSGNASENSGSSSNKMDVEA